MSTVDGEHRELVFDHLAEPARVGHQLRVGGDPQADRPVVAEDADPEPLVGRRGHPPEDAGDVAASQVDGRSRAGHVVSTPTVLLATKSVMPIDSAAGVSAMARCSANTIIASALFLVRVIRDLIWR